MNMVHPGGRPRKFSDAQIKELQVAFEKYIDKTPIPIIVEFCSQNKIIRQNLYDYSEFATLLKQCTEKKEANLEKLALLGKINVTQAIFSLKQLGWSDKQQTEITGKDRGPLKIVKAEDLTDDELAAIIRDGE